MLAQIRKVAYSFLTDRCDVMQETTSSRGATGEPIKNWMTVAANVPCRIIKPGNTGSATAQALPALQDTLQEVYRVALPVDIPLGVDFRIASGGEEYDVVRIEQSLTDQMTRIAIVSRRNGFNA